MIINENNSMEDQESFWKSVPNILYKYRDWSNCDHRKIIKQNKLWLSSPKGLNDPYDCQLPVIPDKDEITSKPFLEFIKTESPLGEDSYERWEEIKKDPMKYFSEREYIFLDAYSQFGIFSLCEESDNFLLWSHYSNAHKGFCIGFNIKSLTIDCVHGTLDRVKYRCEFPKFEFLNQDESLQKALTTKHILWEYEKEWRLIKINAEDKEILFDSSIISEIYLGARMTDNEKEELINSVRGKNEAIKFYEMKLSRNLFKVEAIRI